MICRGSRSCASKALTYAPTGAASRHRLVRCQSRSVVLATGTIGSAGCATRRHAARFHECWILRRSDVGVIGYCGPLPEVLPRFRPCMGLPARNGSPNGRSPGFQATRARNRCGLAMPPPINYRSTFLVRSWTHCTWHVLAAFKISRKDGIFSVPFFATSAFHSFESDGMGRIRPSDQERGGLS
jgi:hypothetical protein